MICTRETPVGSIIGEPCPVCGHTNIVHPGRNNPALDGCLLCVLTAKLDDPVNSEIAPPAEAGRA
jgi:hypothetical protein